VELSEALEAQQRDARQRIGTDVGRLVDVPREPLSVPAPDSVDKSLSSFSNAVCKDFVSGSVKFVHYSCKWLADTKSISTPSRMDSDGGIYIDCSYVWNATRWTAWMTLSASTWEPHVDPYWYKWVQWGGVYSSAIARLALPDYVLEPPGVPSEPVRGELGITVQNAVPN
jgi:hypothetical protein